MVFITFIAFLIRGLRVTTTIISHFHDLIDLINFQRQLNDIVRNNAFIYFFIGGHLLQQELDLNMPNSQLD